MHVEGLEQQVRLVAHALAQALVLGLGKVVLQDRLVVRVRALLDDDARTLLGRQAADVGETLLRIMSVVLSYSALGKGYVYVVPAQ